MMIVAGAIPPAILGETYFRLGEKALALAERAVTRAYVELLMGIFFNGRGRLAESAQRLAPALATFREYGHGRRAEECLTNIFYLYLFRGKFPEAREAVEDLKASTAQRGDDQRLGWALVLEAHLTLPTGGPAATLKILGPAAGDRWDALTRNSFHASSAIAHFRLGETDRAREHAQLALDRLASAPPVSYTAMLDCSNVAEVFLGLSAAAPDLARQARRAVRTLRLFALSFPIGRPRAHLWTGLERWQRGRAAAAEANWRKGLAAAGRLAMPHDRALLHGHLALVHGASERARAAELFTQLGAHAELACWCGTGE